MDNLAHKLVQWHYKFRHPQWMAKSGILPPCLTTCRVPQCMACYNDKAPIRLWKEKGSANVESNQLTDKATTAENMPQITSNQLTDKATTGENLPQFTETLELHLIETFEDFEAGLLQQDYEQTESQLDNPTHELFWWLYKLGHEPFCHLQWMVLSGIIPQHPANC
jgi:hypothetical protein